MDLPILRYLDVFIGFVFVMIMGCTVVAAITQLITSTFYLRAQYLRQGLADLLKQIDPTLPPAACSHLAQLIQRHPSVARAATGPGLLTSAIRAQLVKRGSRQWLPADAPADVIQRHEFLRIVLEWAASEGVFAAVPQLSDRTGQVRQAVVRAGVGSPADVFRSLQFFALQQERTNPGLAAHLWHTAAAIDACPSSFVSKIHGRYDAMTTRISGRFALQAKLIGSLVAIGIALYLPLDSIQLIQRLSADDQFRGALVKRASALSEQLNPSPASPKAPLTPDQENQLKDQLKQTQDYLNSLSQVGVGGKMTGGLLNYTKDHLAGLALSWILLSLGTPFWYDALKQALRLRSVVASNDDQDKADRQRTDIAASAAARSGEVSEVGLVTVTARPVSEPVND